MAKTDSTQAAAEVAAEEMVKRIKANDGAFDSAYVVALARHEFSKWMGEPRANELAQRVAELLSKRLDLRDDNEVTLFWFEDSRDERTRELIEAQRDICDEIDLAKASLEAASERKKVAQADIDEGNSRLRQLARDLSRPYVYQLPHAPERQRDLPIMDGEEWRRVALADVLTGNAALKAVVAEKLGGRVTLGEYGELAEKFGAGDKPKKLTRKQWDQVEEAVQAWFAANTPEPAAT